MQNERIALNFLPLSQQEFEFDVYRHVYHPVDKKEDFQSSTRRRLPTGEYDNFQNKIYSDYWVSLQPINGFESYTCFSKTNDYLTLELVFSKLFLNCQERLPKTACKLDSGFRNRIIFTLSEFEEGFQGVWLEPYYLKSVNKFGFLIDFKFYKLPNVKFSRKVQQLSLSLDKSGKSNVNYYAERYEMLQRFIS